jgi:hypothetical protein
MRTAISLSILLALASIASAQAPVPAGDAPKIGLASATQKDGKVTIDVFELRDVIGRKMPNGTIVFIEQRHWSSLATGTLGKDIRAYLPDGKLASKEAVLKALGKGQGVAYFIGFDKNREIQPDPFYLGMLKDGGVALAFDRPELAVPVP